MDPKTSTAKCESELADKLGMQLLSLSADLTEITMPVAGNTQIHGVLHGGATAALCETAASLAATVHARSLDPVRVAVGSELSISHLRPGREGAVTARATAVHLGSSSTVHEVLVTDMQGRPVSAARVTNRLLLV